MSAFCFCKAKLVLLALDNRGDGGDAIWFLTEIGGRMIQPDRDDGLAVGYADGGRGALGDAERRSPGKPVNHVLTQSVNHVALDSFSAPTIDMERFFYRFWYERACNAFWDSFQNPAPEGLTVIRSYKSCGWGRERCDRKGRAVFLRPRADSASMGSASTGISTSSTKLKKISTLCRRLPSKFLQAAKCSLFPQPGQNRSPENNPCRFFRCRIPATPESTANS